MDINAEIKTALVQKNSVKLGVLRMLKASLDNLAIEKKAPLEESDVINALRKAAKTREESIQAFTQGNRQDLVDKEQAELLIIQEYLPAPLSEEVVDQVIAQAIEATGATSKKQMGQVIKEAIKLSNNQIDGKTLSMKIGKLLS